MQSSQHRASNGYGENNGSRGMPVFTEDDAGQKHHAASEKRAQRIAETNLQTFIHDLSSEWLYVVRGRIRPDDGLCGIDRAVVGEEDRCGASGCRDVGSGAAG